MYSDILGLVCLSSEQIFVSNLALEYKLRTQLVIFGKFMTSFVSPGHIIAVCLQLATPFLFLSSYCLCASYIKALMPMNNGESP